MVDRGLALIWLLIIVALLDVNGKHVMLLPFIATSHCLEMRSIGVELLRRGHQVTALVPDFFNHKPCLDNSNINIIQYQFSPEVAQNIQSEFKESQKMFFQDDRNLLKFFLGARVISFNFFTATFHSVKKIEERLRSEKFDIAIVDGIPLCQHFFYVAKFLSIPTIAEGSVIEQYLSNTPFQTNIFPSPLSGTTNQMSFSGRLMNFLAQCFSRFLLSYGLQQPDVSILSPELNKFSAEDLYRESLLFIENGDHIVDYPKATFPNFIPAGPLTASPPKPLTPDLEKFMHKSVKGVVYISIGSVVESLPKYIIEKLETVAKDLDEIVIFKSNFESENGNIKHVKWVSQNDVLGHNKTVLFLSHCGKNSFLESLYHGVPIICMPFNVDAFGMASKAEHFKIGAQFDIRTTTVEEIGVIVKNVLNDRKIRENIQRASSLIKDRPFTPAETACNAIEHVFKYGSDHMRSPMKDLSFLAYCGGDVWMVVFVALFFLCWLTTKLFLKCVLRFINK